MIEVITNFFVTNGGYIALFILFFDRLAKLTPTEVDNKYLGIVLNVVYKVFAILGVKVPEIK